MGGVRLIAEARGYADAVLALPENRAAVERLATALLRRGVLTGAEVRRLIKEDG